MAHYRIWLRRLNRSGRWSRLLARSLLNACQRARSNLSRQKCRVQIPSELLVTPHLTKQVQVATLSMWRYGFGLRSTPVGAERVPKGTQHPVGVIRWLLRSSVIITGGSSMGELLIKTNPARDFNSNFKNCYPKAEVIGSNPIHRAVGHIQQYQPMAP